VIISQQLHDRGYTGGGSFDAVVGKQLEQQLQEAINKYVLNKAIENGEAVSGGTEAKVETLYKDLAAAREKITDTSGVRLRPTILATTSDQYSFWTRQFDKNERPIVLPQFAAGFPIAQNADDEENRRKWARFSGTVLPGGLVWILDDCIPAVGTTIHTQLVVSAAEESIVLCESEQPILEVFPQTDAATLQVIVRLRSYVAAITRHSGGTATISGAAYVTTQV
jgi:hypothetical protein